MGLTVMAFILFLDLAVIYHIRRVSVSKQKKAISTIVILFLPILGIIVYYLFLNKHTYTNRKFLH